MKYEIIRPPFILEFRTMSQREASEYYGWFIEQIPIRIRILEQVVQSVPSYQSWQADGTPESLDKLGHWFSQQVRTRKKTEKEKEEIYRKAPSWFRNVETGDWELTDQTLSLAIDIGMYFGYIIKKNVPGLEWILIKKPRNDADFQQPVLAGKSKLVLNPVRIVVTYAYSLADISQGPGRLRELYNTWVGIFQ
jgi:hypothetical protein